VVAARRDVLIVLALLPLVAACDQVFGLDGRTEPGLDGGGTGDGSIPSEDGSSTTCSFVEPSQGGVAANAWFPDAALAQAVRMNSQGFIELGGASGKTVDMLVASDYSSAFVSLPASYSAMVHPSLSADGELLVGVLLHDDQVTYRLATASRALQMFSSPAPVDLRTESNATWTLSAAHTPSGPTTGTPQLLVISDSLGVTEVVRQAATWRATRTTLATAFGLGAITYATLTSDGLGLVLVGTTLANPGAQKVMLATRDSVDMPFASASEIFRPLGVGTRSAYLTADCSRLFFLQQGEVRWVDR
jgi:hypothetical protein